MEKSRIRDKHPGSATLAVGHTFGRLPDRELRCSYIALGPVTGIEFDSSETRMRMVAQFLNNYLTKTKHDFLSI